MVVVLRGFGKERGEGFLYECCYIIGNDVSGLGCFWIFVELEKGIFWRFEFFVFIVLFVFCWFYFIEDFMYVFIW